MHTAQKDYKLLVHNASVCDIKHPIIGNKSMEKIFSKKDFTSRAHYLLKVTYSLFYPLLYDSLFQRVRDPKFRKALEWKYSCSFPSKTHLTYTYI